MKFNVGDREIDGVRYPANHPIRTDKLDRSRVIARTALKAKMAKEYVVITRILVLELIAGEFDVLQKQVR